MSRRSRRIQAPPRPSIRSKEKDLRPFAELMIELDQRSLSQSDVHRLMNYLYGHYEGEFRYFNRLLKDKEKMIV